MKKHLRTLKLLSLLFVLLISACGGAKEKEAAETAVAQTMQVVEAQSTAIAETILQLTRDAEAAAKTPTEIPATITPIPSANTPLPTITSGAAQPAAPAGGSGSALGSGDRAEFVTETIPDGTKYAPGATFTKTWQLVNKGSTTWSTAYALVYSSGDQLADKTTVNLPYAVAPNQTVEIAVAMKAPATNGTFKSNWLLRNANGQDFGIGGGVNPVWVQIVVADGVAAGTGTVTPTITGTLGTAVPTSTVTPDPAVVFAVTNVAAVSYSTEPSSITCGTNITLKVGGSITTNNSGTVKFKWVLDGVPQSEISMVFSSPSTQAVYNAFSYGPITAGKTGTLGINITSPNITSATPLNMTFSCTP